MTSSRVKHAQELRRAAATNNVAREQDNASKEKAKTMVEELQCKSLTAPESDTVQQDWAAHRATWLDETSNALPHHRKGERGQRKKDGLAPKIFKSQTKSRSHAVPEAFRESFQDLKPGEYLTCQKREHAVVHSI